MKVGRAALDEDAIRLLEELNPDLEFDWTRILKGETSRPEEPRQEGPQKRFGRRFDDQRRPPRDGRPRVEPGAATPVQTAPAESARTTEELPRESAAAAGGAEADVEEPQLDELQGADAEEEDSGGDGLLAEPHLPQPEQFPEGPPTAAHARLGTEAVLRLRGRYAEVLARLHERVRDADQLEQLKAQAERLNPDAWVTDAEVATGLEEYEEVFESLRAVVGRRKRRRRRGPQPGAGEP